MTYEVLFYLIRRKNIHLMESGGSEAETGATSPSRIPFALAGFPRVPQTRRHGMGYTLLPFALLPPSGTWSGSYFSALSWPTFKGFLGGRITPGSSTTFPLKVESSLKTRYLITEMGYPRFILCTFKSRRISFNKPKNNTSISFSWPVPPPSIPCALVPEDGLLLDCCWQPWLHQEVSPSPQNAEQLSLGLCHCYTAAGCHVGSSMVLDLAASPLLLLPAYESFLTPWPLTAACSCWQPRETLLPHSSWAVSVGGRAVPRHNQKEFDFLNTSQMLQMFLEYHVSIFPEFKCR